MVCPECGCLGPHTAPISAEERLDVRADWIGSTAAGLLLLALVLFTLKAPPHDRAFGSLIIGMAASVVAPIVGLIFGSAGEVIRYLRSEEADLIAFRIRAVARSAYMALIWTFFGSIVVSTAFLAFSMVP